MVADDDRVLLLRDAEGNCYALPWYLVLRSKVPAEVVAELDADAGEDGEDGRPEVDEVSGFRLSYFNGTLLSASDLSTEQTSRRPKVHLANYFRSVLMQQGRVQLDGDWPP